MNLPLPGDSSKIIQASNNSKPIFVYFYLVNHNSYTKTHTLLTVRWWTTPWYTQLMIPYLIIYVNLVYAPRPFLPFLWTRPKKKMLQSSNGSYMNISASKVILRASTTLLSLRAEWKIITVMVSDGPQEMEELERQYLENNLH